MTDLQDFTYEDDLHEYRDGAGDLKKSVTGTLKDAGIVNYSMVDPVVLEDKRVLGQNVHKWTAVHDTEGDNDPTAVNLREWKYCQGWLAFKNDFKPELIEIEQPMMRPIGDYLVGGTPDVFCMIKRRLWLIDRKCCSSVMPAWELQLADYEMMKSRAPYLGIYGRMSVVLKPDGSYKPVVYEDPQAAIAGRAAVALAYNPKDENARRIVDAWCYNHKISRL